MGFTLLTLLQPGSIKPLAAITMKRSSLAARPTARCFLNIWNKIKSAAAGIKSNRLCSRRINVRTSRVCSVGAYSVPQRNASQRT